MKVKVFEGHKVPKGATKYQPDTGRYHESFWDDKGNVWVIGIAERWIRAASVIPNDLIELPEQQEDKVEWVPTVGELCEITCLGESVNCLYLGFDVMGNYAYQVSSGEFRGSFNTEGERHHFRPLKTDEQKKREAFDLKALEVYKPYMSCKEFAAALFDAGFTAPEGGGVSDG